MITVGIGFAIALGPASAAQQQARVIDRTVTCATGLEGGLRSVSLEASSYSRERGAYVEALTRVQPTARLAAVGTGGLQLSPSCVPSRTTVSLTARGLPGSTASQVGEEWDCEVPRSVVVRVRAVFERTAPRLRRSQQWGFPMLIALAPVREGALAVRTPSGRPLALARMLPSGKVQLFTSGACFPD